MGKPVPENLVERILAKVKDALVEARPMVHSAAVHIMRQMVERVQPDRAIIGHRAHDRIEVDVPDARPTALIDQIQE